MVRTDRVLRSAFLALLERKQLDQITIRDICAEAGVHYATFFRHHPSKEALLDHVAADQIDRLVELTLPVQEAIDHQAGFLALCTYIEDHRPLWTTLLNGGAGQAMREELLRVSLAVASRRASQDSWLPVELATRCTVSVIVETISWWLNQPAGAFGIEQAAKMLDRLVAGSFLLSSPSDI